MEATRSDLSSPDANCRLCGNRESLKESHILPAFVFRWLKDNALGRIRMVETPNVRVQDGVKRYLLCARCEGRLSSWEKPFSETVFARCHQDISVAPDLTYGPWALKFAVSVSWRVLVLHLSEGYLAADPGIAKSIQESETTWRRFLLGECANPGPYEQHLLALSAVESANTPLSSRINRYFLGAVDMTILSGDRSALTFAKMGRAVVIGHICGFPRNAWKNTRLHANRGVIDTRRHATGCPTAVLDFLNARADLAMRRPEDLSPAQMENIEYVRARLKAQGKRWFTEGLERDVALFGDEALHNGSPSRQEPPNMPIEPTAAPH